MASSRPTANHSRWKMRSASRAKCPSDRYAARGSVRIISVGGSTPGVVSIVIPVYPDPGSVMVTDLVHAVYHGIDPGRMRLE
jgi:hypothetical protein